MAIESRYACTIAFTALSTSSTCRSRLSRSASSLGGSGSGRTHSLPRARSGPIRPMTAGRRAGAGRRGTGVELLGLGQRRASHDHRGLRLRPRRRGRGHDACARLPIGAAAGPEGHRHRARTFRGWRQHHDLARPMRNLRRTTLDGSEQQQREMRRGADRDRDPWSPGPSAKTAEVRRWSQAPLVAWPRARGPAGRPPPRAVPRPPSGRCGRSLHRRARRSCRATPGRPVSSRARRA